MFCRGVRKELIDYIKDFLPFPLKERIGEHLSNCEKCRKEYKEIKETLKICHSLEEVEPSSGFDIALESRLKEEEPKLKRAIPRKRYYPRLMWGDFGVRVAALGVVAGVLVCSISIINNIRKERELLEFEQLSMLPENIYISSYYEPGSSFSAFLSSGTHYCRVRAYDSSIQDEFGKPMRLAKDNMGNIYVTNPLARTGWYTYSQSWRLGNHRIQKLDQDGNIILTFGQNGRNLKQFFALKDDGTVWTWGSNWYGQLQLGDGTTTNRYTPIQVSGLSGISAIAGGDEHTIDGPTDVAVDSQGNIYVVGNNTPSFIPPWDTWWGWYGIGTIQKFDSSGNFISDFLVYGDGNTAIVEGISLDSKENIYVADSVNCRILKFSNEGKYLENVVKVVGLYWPQDIEIDDEDNILIVDAYSLMKFDKEGSLLFRIWGTESGFGQIYPRGLDVDSNTNIWVADTYNNRILCFAPDGEFLFKFGTQGFDIGEFQLPWDVIVDRGRIFVSDTYNQRIQFFDLYGTVQIDIKPGSFLNSVDLGSKGTLPVAILSTPDFDATNVDPMTVTLAGAPVELKGDGAPFSIEDINSDGRFDMVVYVNTQSLQLNETETTAILDGETFDGIPIRGVDTVKVVSQRQEKSEIKQ